MVAAFSRPVRREDPRGLVRDVHGVESCRSRAQRVMSNLVPAHKLNGEAGVPRIS